MDARQFMNRKGISDSQSIENMPNYTLRSEVQPAQANDQGHRRAAEYCGAYMCTKIGAFKSSYKMISRGVPQGSVLSPLLFLIYINDITKASSFHTTLFADGINLHMSNSCSNVLQTTVPLNYVKLTTG